MERVKISEYSDRLQTMGRTFMTKRGLYCNWTCSGIRFAFRGNSLAVRIQAFPSQEQELNTATAAFESRDTWPWLAVFVDDENEPVRYLEINRKDDVYPLAVFEDNEAHTVIIRKITENAKGKICLTEFCIDGTIEAMPDRADKLKLEFIGDSITCGFGNMVNDANRMFYTVDENGWMAHPAVAARMLQADFSVVSCSGIAVTDGIGKFAYALPPMKYYYPYCDRMAQELEGKEEDKEEEPKLREYNGVTPWIICALGSLDYFLYDSIQKVAERFRQEYSDKRISCFKYGRVRVNDGLGACRHPYVTTQIRMGEELAEYIRECHFPKALRSMRRIYR